MPDHVHIFVDVPQSVALGDVVRTLKSINAIELFKAFPQLIQFYIRCSVSWSRGYFVSRVTKYIKEQKNDK
ncbi:transposase [Catenibacterium mitsuokai]|uniref:transposase n=1 Tax=Catenibacterium mitsuokai TaxID=100886 RepID=UPI003A5232D2